MSAHSPQIASHAALSAFLRGVERRAAVFAQLHCGDAIRGDEALATTMVGFRGVSAHSPIAEWPRRFWALLLASPLLRDLGDAPTWPPALRSLAGLGSGPRAALLLRLVGGLSEGDAAAVLGVARPTYRLALQKALPHGADGQPDVDSWKRLGVAIQAEVKALPAPRLAHIARLREDAIAGRHVDPRRLAKAAQDQAEIDDRTRLRWRRPALAGVATAVVLALAVTFFLPGDAPDAPGDPRIVVAPLPSADPPAATFDPAMAMPTERDFAQLASGSDDAFLRDLDFYAWYAAHRDGSIDEAALRMPAQPQVDPAPDDQATLETTDATL